MGRNSRIDGNTDSVPAIGLRRHIRALSDFFFPPPEEPHIESHLSLRVDRKSFEDALEQKEVQHLLEDLEVSISTRHHLFEVLDADGNGYLAVSELAAGIMRLRGPADKGDAVSAIMKIRSLQKSFRLFREVTLQNQQAMMEHLGLQPRVLRGNTFGEDSYYAAL